MPEPLHAALSALAGGGLSDRAHALTARASMDRLESGAVTLVLDERERERETVNALRASTGGPDDNRAQAGHLIVQPRSSQAKDAVTATTSTERHG